MLCCPVWAKFSRNYIYSIMSPVHTFEKEKDIRSFIVNADFHSFNYISESNGHNKNLQDKKAWYLCALRCGGTVEKLNTLSTREIDFVHETSWLRNVQRQYSFVWSISIFFFNNFRKYCLHIYSLTNEELWNVIHCNTFCCISFKSITAKNDTCQDHS